MNGKRLDRRDKLYRVDPEVVFEWRSGGHRFDAEHGAEDYADVVERCTGTRPTITKVSLTPTTADPERGQSQ